MATEQDAPENSDFAAFARRIITRFGRRVGEGDIDALPDLLALREQLDSETADAVLALRAAPHFYSWQQIADRLGITRQAALQRWRRPGAEGRQPGGQPSAHR